ERGGPRFVPLVEAVGPGALPPALRRGPTGEDRRPVPQGVRVAPGPAPSVARRVPALGADEARPVSLVRPLLLGGQAANGPRSRPAARRRRRREPRRVRAAA